MLLEVPITLKIFLALGRNPLSLHIPKMWRITGVCVLICDVSSACPMAPWCQFWFQQMSAFFDSTSPA
jgi:hypothetical protein